MLSHFRALLIDGGVQADRNVVVPINLSILIKRKVFLDQAPELPNCDVSCTLECISVSLLKCRLFSTLNACGVVTPLNAPQTWNDRQSITTQLLHLAKAN